MPPATNQVRYSFHNGVWIGRRLYRRKGKASVKCVYFRVELFGNLFDLDDIPVSHLCIAVAVAGLPTINLEQVKRAIKFDVHNNPNSIIGPVLQSLAALDLKSPTATARLFLGNRVRMTDRGMLLDSMPCSEERLLLEAETFTRECRIDARRAAQLVGSVRPPDIPAWTETSPRAFGSSGTI